MLGAQSADACLCHNNVSVLDRVIPLYCARAIAKHMTVS